VRRADLSRGGAGEFWHCEWIFPDKALRVSINGGTPVARLIDPSIGDLLDDYRERRDPRLLYYDRLSFP